MIDVSSPESVLRSYIKSLPFWREPVTLDLLVGGLCNKNFVARHGAETYVVRVGGDVWVHGIVQASVQNAMQAATELGVTAALRYAEPGVVISDFIEGRQLRADDVNDEKVLRGWVETVRRLHLGSSAVRGSVIYFWPFQVVRHYMRYCEEHGSRIAGSLAELAEINESLERQVEPFAPVLTHNDVVPQNAMLGNDGEVYLIDWDYGAYGNPFFDIAGIATNADASPEVEERIIELYFGRVDEGLRRQFQLFKLMINLREHLWGAVQELSSKLDLETVQAGMSSLYPDQAPGYEGYTEMNRQRLLENLTAFKRLYG